MLRLTGFALALALLGCTSADTPIETPERRIDLRAATGNASISPAGVAVDPTGARFVFDDSAGLYQLGAGGAFELILPLAAMPDPGVPVRPPFTDLVAVGPDQFAITALGDGYLLDVALGTMRPYFCYLPDGLPESYDQRTDAVAYDPAARLLYAQPRTFDENGNLIGAQVASYSVETGTDLQWWTAPQDMAAGGMAKLPDGPLVIADGSRLWRFEGDQVASFDDLARLGIGRISGLAVDAAHGTILVLDGDNDALIELDRADITP